MPIDFFPKKLTDPLDPEENNTFYTRQCRLFPSDITFQQIKDARPSFPTVGSFLVPPTVSQQDHVLISMQHIHSMLEIPLEAVSLLENPVPFNDTDELEITLDHYESMYLESWDQVEEDPIRSVVSNRKESSSPTSATSAAIKSLAAINSPRRHRRLYQASDDEKEKRHTDTRSIVPRAPSFIPQHRSASVAHNIAGRIVSTTQRRQAPKPMTFPVVVQKVTARSQEERSESQPTKDDVEAESVVSTQSRRSSIKTHRALRNSVIPLRSDLQERLESVLSVLKVSAQVKLDLVMKYTNPKYAMQLSQALILWEEGSELVLKREEVLRKIRHFEMKASDPRRHFHSISTERLVEERNRRVLTNKFDAISQQCREKLMLLLNSFQDQLIFQDQIYLDKMAKDYVSTLHEIEQLRYRFYKASH